MRNNPSAAQLASCQDHQEYPVIGTATEMYDLNKSYTDFVVVSKSIINKS